mmetsp:Transcript_9409/g.20638  ORF Transcript_9409/g.20638 Transcript_9409/m.20638 type:complete len:110 (+) Transcript_9409:1680-2009(+)
MMRAGTMATVTVVSHVTGMGMVEGSRRSRRNFVKPLLTATVTVVSRAMDTAMRTAPPSRLRRLRSLTHMGTVMAESLATAMDIDCHRVPENAFWARQRRLSEFGLSFVC